MSAGLIERSRAPWVRPSEASRGPRTRANTRRGIGAMVLAGVCGLALLRPHLASAAVLSVVDDAGARVELAQPAQRIVSLAPHATELLFAAGAGDRLVAVSRYSDYPPAARVLPRIGDSSALDLERIAMLHPDLVVAWGSALSPANARALASLGIAIFRSEPHTLVAIADDLVALGRLAGSDVIAGAVAGDFRRRVARLRDSHARLRPVSVFFQIWAAPLMTVNHAQVISDALRICGGRNLFDTASQQVVTVDPEQVVAADPELIASGTSDISLGAHAPAFDRWRALPTLRAVRGGHLLAIDADLIARPAPRILSAVETLCEALDAVRRERGP